jgi:hypothetical protein
MATSVRALVMLEILDRTLVSLRRLSRTERSQVFVAPGFGIFLARIQAKLAGF